MRIIDHQARLVIYDLPTMGKRKRTQLSLWLKRIAAEISSEDPKIFRRKFIARLMK